MNARELHQFLESKQDFTTWLKKRIEKYDYVENINYFTIEPTLATMVTENSVSTTLHPSKNANLAKNYLLTVSMAKELCMIEDNFQGKKARAYYIACEKILLIMQEFKKLLMAQSDNFPTHQPDLPLE